MRALGGWAEGCVRSAGGVAARSSSRARLASLVSIWSALGDGRCARAACQPLRLDNGCILRQEVERNECFCSSEGSSFTGKSTRWLSTR